MTYIYYAIYGFFVGVLAKSLFFKEDKGGVIPTILLGMIGSMLSGYILSLFNIPMTKGLSLYGLLPAVVGTLFLMFAVHYIKSFLFKK